MQKFLATTLFATMLISSGAHGQQEQKSQDVAVVEGTMRSTSFITNDIDACIDFYSQLLGYHVLGQSTITAEKSRQVVGARGDAKVTRYVSMAPVGWTIENQDLRAGVSFIEIEGADATPFDQNPERSSRAGELVLAHRVKNIEEIARRAAEMGVPIIAPLGHSGSGKSKSMAVLDPNGVRVEMYEY